MTAEITPLYGAILWNSASSDLQVPELKINMMNELLGQRRPEATGNICRGSFLFMAEKSERNPFIVWLPFQTKKYIMTPELKVFSSGSREYRTGR